MRGLAINKQFLPRIFQSIGRGWLLAAVLMALSAIGLTGSVQADAPQSSSSHYGVSEVQFGSGSALHDCSGNYCAKMSVGDTVVGHGSSANYSAQFGFNTSDVPVLELIASSGVQDMGVLDTNKTGTATGTVKIRSYLSSGYVLQITGQTPDQGVHHLDSPSTPTASQQGSEQFGINLVDNATPNIGANPVQVPDGTFSFGTVEPNYKQADKYMYQDGDVVARSTSASGETDYTISFIANISSVTAGGRYNGAFTAVVVPTY